LALVSLCAAGTVSASETDDFLWTFHDYSTSIDLEKMEAYKGIGVSVYSLRIRWKWVEPEVPDEPPYTLDEVTWEAVDEYAYSQSLDWGPYDQKLQALVDAGFLLVLEVGLGGYDSETTYQGKPATPDDSSLGKERYLARVALHTRGVVRRYEQMFPGKVILYVPEGELEMAGAAVLYGWRPGNSWAEYPFVTKVAQVLADAVKAEAPDTPISLWVEDISLLQIAAQMNPEPGTLEEIAQALIYGENKLLLGDMVGFEDDNENGVKDEGESPAFFSQLIYDMSDEEMADYLHSFQIGLNLEPTEIGYLVRTLIDTKPVTQEATIKSWVPWFDMVGFSAFTNYYSSELEEGANGFMVGHMAKRLVAAFPSTPIIVMTTGYPSGPGSQGFSEENQAQFMEELLEAAFEAGVSGIIWEALISNDKTGLPEDHPWAVEGFWGLMRPDPEKEDGWFYKPAWYVFKEAIENGPPEPLPPEPEPEPAPEFVEIVEQVEIVEPFRPEVVAETDTREAGSQPEQKGEFVSDDLPSPADGERPQDTRPDEISAAGPDDTGGEGDGGCSCAVFAPARPEGPLAGCLLLGLAVLWLFLRAYDSVRIREGDNR